ncbi:uncharacterized protein [Hyperolius riggenbachi]|uniref:uncharacterized protein n=1 Tax=Hyperolius riggenbachi TaxID=752182 RepID=UPI0035A325EC
MEAESLLSSSGYLVELVERDVIRYSFPVLVVMEKATAHQQIQSWQQREERAVVEHKCLSASQIHAKTPVLSIPASHKEVLVLVWERVELVELAVNQDLFHKVPAAKEDLEALESVALEEWWHKTLAAKEGLLLKEPVAKHRLLLKVPAAKVDLEAQEEHLLLKAPAAKVDLEAQEEHLSLKAPAAKVDLEAQEEHLLLKVPAVKVDLVAQEEHLLLKAPAAKEELFHKQLVLKAHMLIRDTEDQEELEEDTEVEQRSKQPASLNQKNEK